MCTRLNSQLATIHNTTQLAFDNIYHGNSTVEFSRAQLVTFGAYIRIYIYRAILCMELILENIYQVEFLEAELVSFGVGDHVCYDSYIQVDTRYYRPSATKIAYKLGVGGDKFVGRQLSNGAWVKARTLGAEPEYLLALGEGFDLRVSGAVQDRKQHVACMCLHQSMCLCIYLNLNSHSCSPPPFISPPSCPLRSRERRYGNWRP